MTVAKFRWRRPVWFVLFLSLLLVCSWEDRVVFVTGSVSPASFQQRCRSMDIVDPLIGFNQSECGICKEDSVTATTTATESVVVSNSSHVMFLLSSASTDWEQYGAVVAALLAKDYRVSILYHHTNDTATTPLRLPEHLAPPYIPCHKRAHLNFQTILSDEQTAHHDDDDFFPFGPASMTLVQKLVKMGNLQHEVTSEITPPDVLIADAFFLAGVTAMTLSATPSIVLLREQEFDASFGWIQQQWFLLERNWQLVRAFWAWNRIRWDGGWLRMQGLNDFWENHAVLKLPHLLPVCVPCHVVEKKRDPEELAVVLLEPLPYLHKRKVLRGLAIARASLEQMNASNFYVVTDNPTDLQPDFVAVEESAHLIDTVFRNWPVAAVLSTCQLAPKGLPRYCVSESTTPRDIALGLMRLPAGAHMDVAEEEQALSSQATLEIEGTASPLPNQDPLQWLLRVVERAAATKFVRGNPSVWRNGEIESSRIEDALQLHLDSPFAPLNDWFSVFAALEILLVSVLYMLASKDRLRRQIRRSRNNPRATIVVGILLQMPELDRVWKMWQSWFAQEIERWNGMTTRTTPPETTKTASRRTQQNIRNRRRKKRH